MVQLMNQTLEAIFSGNRKEQQARNDSMRKRHAGNHSRRSELIISQTARGMEFVAVNTLAGAAYWSL